MKLIFALCLFAITATAQTNAPRTWTLKTGAVYTGEYFTSGAQFVVLKSNGTNCLLKISDLTTDDLIYVKDCKLAALERQIQTTTVAATAGQAGQTVRLLTPPDQWGKCEIQTVTGRLKVQLLNIPKPALEFVTKVKQTQDKIAESTAKEKSLRLAAARADANANNIVYSERTDYNTVASLRNRREAEAKNLLVDADEAAANVVELKKQLAELELKRDTETTITASPTGKSYYELPCWQAQ